MPGGSDETPTGQRWWVLAGIIAILALLASINGLRNDFTYDDRFIILGNDLVHNIKRAWALLVLPYWPISLGGDGYRPLTLIAFAVQWAIAPGSAVFFHATSIALYVATSVAAFRLASLLLPIRYAWLVAAFFAVHPVHVEAVANLVGQSEVWVGLLLFIITATYIDRRHSEAFGAGPKALIASLYFAACLFKEHAVVAPMIFVAAEALILRDASSLRGRLRRERPFYLFLLLIAVFFVAFRYLVIHKGAAGFAPFIPFVSLKVSGIDRALTMVGLVPEWVRLFLWPATLIPDYSPPQFATASGLDVVQLPGFLILGGVIGLLVATARRFPVVAFGIAWTIITLLPSSNFLLPSGILIAERTLFTPSFGVLLAICATLPAVEQQIRTSAVRILVLVGVQTLLLAGVVKSIVQTATWRDNLTLFTTAVVASPLGYRTHYMLGAWLMAKKDYVHGEREYLRAIELFPYDPFVVYNLGQEYLRAGLYDRAYLQFAKAEAIMSPFEDAQARLAVTRAMQGRYRDATRLANRAIENHVGDFGILRAILQAAKLDERSKQRLAASLAAKRSPVIAR